MPKAYQNATRTPIDATFVEVGDHDGSLLLVKSKEGTFSPSPGIKVAMVSGVIRVTKPSEVQPAGAAGTVLADESVEIKYNVRKGGTTLDSLHTEVSRIMGIAKTDYNLAYGLVPPSEATFAEI